MTMSTASAVPRWTFGERLRKARKEAGITREEMAKIFEVKPATISNWENDQRQPERFMPTVQKWAEVTGCSEGWLLGIDAALGYKRHPAGLSLVASSE